MFSCYISDSDDSENEGGLGNVTRVVMRPPGQSGKAKRGHLCFDASFETGKSTFKKQLIISNIKRVLLTQQDNTSLRGVIVITISIHLRAGVALRVGNQQGRYKRNSKMYLTTHFWWINSVKSFCTIKLE